jgi:hypothetical protein
MEQIGSDVHLREGRIRIVTEEGEILECRGSSTLP